jgi:predicted dienelactone hydrolase
MKPLPSSAHLTTVSLRFLHRALLPALLIPGSLCLLQPSKVLADPRPRPATAPAAPTASPAVPASAPLKLDWVDASRQRSVPVLIYLPPASPATKAEPVPVIIFSHGLGGSREGYSYLGQHWSQAGYASVHVQHLGSDDAVWREARPAERMQAVKKAAATPANALARPADVTFVIDELTRQNQDPKSPLHGQLDLSRIGAAGHSFGGFTVMAIAGQSFRGGVSPLADARVKAVIQMSAPVIGGQRVAQEAFDNIRIPVFHMTGTLDDSPVGETMAADRRIPYDRMQHASTCLVIFKDGDHMIFSGRMQRDPEREAADEAFQKLITKSTTAFWDAHLKNKADSRKWLYEGGFTSVLGSSGTFEHKAPAE